MSLPPGDALRGEVGLGQLVEEDDGPEVGKGTARPPLGPPAVLLEVGVGPEVLGVLDRVREEARLTMSAEDVQKARELYEMAWFDT